jgi:hypothetical protein
MSLVTAILAAMAPFLPSVITAGVAGVISATLGIGVHEIVTPVTTMVEKVTEAATEATTKTVEALGVTTVGTVGEVTTAAQNIITSTVHDVVGVLKG